MTNATLPLLVKIAWGGTIAVCYVDQFAAIQSLISTETSINGTHYIAFKNGAGTSYVTPAATKLNIFAFENITTAIVANYTVLQIGYDDDGAGTNFVSLFDAFAAGFGQNTLNSSNIATGYITVPTGKHLVLKSTNSAATSTTRVRLIGLETN